MTIAEIRHILESPYDRKVVWSSFIQTQFTNNKMYGSEQKLSLSDTTISKHCLSLGNYEKHENLTKCIVNALSGCFHLSQQFDTLVLLEGESAPNLHRRYQILKQTT